MSLIPHPPAFVHRLNITNHKHPDGQQAIGTVYQFIANITDAATIPLPSYTTIKVGAWQNPAEPWIWRAACANPEVCITVEDVSDAGTSSLKQEARKCWQSLSTDINSRCRRMSLIGLHEDIIRRISDPLQLRTIEVRTLHQDMLARMFAQGSAEIARCAGVLHMVDQRQQNRQPLAGTHLETFLWGDDGIPETARRRYQQALNGEYEVVQKRLAP